MVEFSYPEMTYQVGDGFVEATLRSTGGDLNAKKLDLQAGLGSDFLGVLMATFTYATNNSGGTANVFLRDIPGILDRRFGEASADGGQNEHNFLYLPTVAEDGNIWLNNNLGANYSNTNHSAFDPAHQATNTNDFNAAGSLFQWGRRADGHELVNRSSGSTTPTNGRTTTKSDNPNHSLFIHYGSSFPPLTWRITQGPNLWNGENSTNNPCPTGFRLPTEGEWAAYGTALNGVSGVEGDLKLSTTGYRYDVAGDIRFNGPPNRFYWSSTYSTTSTNINHFAIRFDIRETLTRVVATTSQGHAVRCIQN